MRVDQRVEQLFEVMNAVMATSASCRRARLSNTTYKVGKGARRSFFGNNLDDCSDRMFWRDFCDRTRSAYDHGSMSSPLPPSRRNKLLAIGDRFCGNNSPSSRRRVVIGKSASQGIQTMSTPPPSRRPCLLALHERFHAHFRSMCFSLASLRPLTKLGKALMAAGG